MGIRDYGLGEPPKILGPPIIGSRVDIACQHCHAPHMFDISVKLEPPRLLRVYENGHAIGHYIGCAACPYASPMVITGVGDEPLRAGGNEPAETF